MRVLLYSHNSRQEQIDEYVSRSLENIAHNFDEIYFLTNVAGTTLAPARVKPVLLDSRVDFESYIDVFTRFPDVVSRSSMLYLVNDSVLIQSPIDLPDSPDVDVFGLTESRQHGNHIQSYFIGFHGRETIDVAVDYLQRFPGDFSDRDAVIDYCEIGLSHYLIGRRRRVKARFTPPSGFTDNPTRTFWKRLLNDIGIIKRNVLLGTGAYGMDAVRLDELVEASHSDDWKPIFTRLHVPRCSSTTGGDPVSDDGSPDLLDEIYGRILLRRCDPSGRATYTEFLRSQSVSDLEAVLRQSPEYQVLQDLATAYREVLGRYPDAHGAHAYRDEVQLENGIERVKAVLRESLEYWYNLEGSNEYRRLCREYARCFANYGRRLERNGSVEAVLIETRREEALRFVIPNTVSRMPRGWGLTIFHGPDNYHFMKEVCARIENVRLSCLPRSVDLSDFRAYNDLLTDSHFWERFESERVLLFQWDCLLVDRDIECFAGYDYIGAPWRNGRVGNGGFSIRNVQVMAGIAARNVRGDFENEDDFFSRCLYAEGFRMPGVKTAGDFCTEFPDESQAYHRPWLARKGARLEELFREASRVVPGDPADTSPIPVLLLVDIEPDPRVLQRPDRWHGFEALHRFMSRQRPVLEDATGSAVNYGWLLRMDPQIEHVYGHADWPASMYRALIDEALDHADEYGVHNHAWRFDGAWYSDYGDARWVTHCVARSHEAFVEAMGFAPLTFTHGDRYMSNAVMEEIESLGFVVDATLQPGRPRIERLVETERARGSLPDFSDVPRRPYYPSRLDYRRADPADARSILEIPLSVSGDRPKSNDDNSLLLGAPFERVRQVIDENLAGPAPYLHAAMRTDVLLDDGNREQFERAMAYLADHPLSHRFVFITPAMLARGVCDTRESRVGMSSVSVPGQILHRER